MYNNVTIRLLLLEAGTPWRLWGDSAFSSGIEKSTAKTLVTPAATGPEVTAHQHEVLLQAPGSVVSGKATNPRATGDSASHQRLPCTLAHAGLLCSSCYLLSRFLSNRKICSFQSFFIWSSGHCCEGVPTRLVYSPTGFNQNLMPGIHEQYIAFTANRADLLSMGPVQPACVFFNKSFLPYVNLGVITISIQVCVILTCSGEIHLLIYPFKFTE